MRTYLRSAGRSWLGTFRFHGRASRAEFLGYLVLSQVPLVVVHWIAAWFAPATMAEAVLVGAMYLASAPLSALSVRRLHDFGRCGWWSLPLLALVGRALLLDLVGLAAGWDAAGTIERALSYVDWLLALPAAAAALALLACPGSKGANRFGPSVEGSERRTTGAAEPAPVV